MRCHGHLKYSKDLCSDPYVLGFKDDICLFLTQDVPNCILDWESMSALGSDSDIRGPEVCASNFHSWLLSSMGLAG